MADESREGRFERLFASTYPEVLAFATMRALAQLSADQREVLMLVAWEGADARIGGEALGCSPGAFRIRLHRARRAYERAVQSAGEIDEAPSEAVKEAP